MFLSIVPCIYLLSKGNIPYAEVYRKKIDTFISPAPVLSHVVFHLGTCILYFSTLILWFQL